VKLNTIILSHNKLSVLKNLNHLKELRKLTVSYNNIGALLDSLINCVNLVDLNIRNNVISRLPPKLTENRKLKIIDASNNKILDYNGLLVLKQLKYLQQLHLIGNPFLEKSDSTEWIEQNLPFIGMKSSKGLKKRKNSTPENTQNADSKPPKKLKKDTENQKVTNQKRQNQNQQKNNQQKNLEKKIIKESRKLIEETAEIPTFISAEELQNFQSTSSNSQQSQTKSPSNTTLDSLMNDPLSGLQSW